MSQSRGLWAVTREQDQQDREAVRRHRVDPSCSSSMPAIQKPCHPCASSGRSLTKVVAKPLTKIPAIRQALGTDHTLRYCGPKMDRRLSVPPGWWKKKLVDLSLHPTIR